MSLQTARRTHGFTESVIRAMTRLAHEHGAINLAQGFPNFSAPGGTMVGGPARYTFEPSFVSPWILERATRL